MSNKQRQVPAIRFTGFNDSWEQRKLGEVSEITKLAGFEFTKYIKYSDTGHIPAIRGLNVKNGNFVFNDVKYIDESDFSKLSRSKLFAGDIVFTYVGTIGEAAIIPENVTWYLAPNVSRIRTTELNPTFLLQLLINPVFRRKEIETWIATSSQPALSMENIRKFEMNIPSHKEQTKIGKFFNNLDKTIALHQRQLDYYKEFKKTMLQKMFPREGEKVPSVRFDGFTVAWEHRKFSDLIQTMRGGASIAPDDYKDNGVATVPKGAINSTGIADLSGSKYVSKEFFEKNKNSSVYSDELVTSLRDLVPSAPNMGRIVKLKGKDQRYLMPQGVYNLILQDEVDENFLISFSNTSKFRKIISQEKNGSTQVHIRNSEYLGISIDAPDAEEQNKIGSFFKKLDVTIALHQKKVNNYQKLKETILQQMFM